MHSQIQNILSYNASRLFQYQTFIRRKSLYTKIYKASSLKGKSISINMFLLSS